MDDAEIRRESGRHLVFRGDGFPFAAAHDVQPDVPPADLVAMWETWREEASHG